MSLAFTLDNNTAALAREGSGNIGGRITETGGYVGEIEFIREIGKPGGANGVEVSFISDDGQSARFRLYVQNAQGEPLAGQKKLYALMACAKVRELKPMSGKVKEWNKDAGGMIEVDATIFPAIAKKRVGIILQKQFEIYEGQQKWKMELFAPFTADTRQTAAESLDKSGSTGMVEKMLASVKDWYKDGAQPSAQAPARSVAPAGSNPPVEFYDDIDF